MSDLKKNMVVVAKVKAFMRDKHELRTSEGFIEELSRIIETECQKAAERVKLQKRKTVRASDLHKT